MKFALSIFLVIIFTECKSQTLREGCWLPEAYVDSLAGNSFKNVASTLKAVHSILVLHDTVFLMSYQSDYLIAATTKIGENKLKVLNFGSLINLAYPEALSYAKKKCFLYQTGDYLVMDIEAEGTIERVQFINRKNDLIFKNPSEVYVRYKLRGRYSLEGVPYIFHPAGKIEGDLWGRFELLRNGYATRDKSRGNYTLILIHGKNGISKYAVKESNEGLLMYTYTVVGQSDYDIKVSETAAYFLKRVQH